MSEYFSLYDLIINNEIKGLIFDKFNQQHHFRLFPYNQKLFGVFEAFVFESVDIRHKTKKLTNLILTPKDESVILYAFLHREQWGIPDGMGDISDPQLNPHRLSPGSRTDNYIFSNDILLSMYNEIETLKEKRRPLPNTLFNILSLKMAYCYFDKVPIKGKGSICYHCAGILRKEGYSVPNSFIAKLRNIKK